MGFRFRKSFKIGKGVKLNVGRKSVGISAGGKRAGFSINSRSGTRARFSLPGTGISYTEKLSGGRKFAKKSTNTKRSVSGTGHIQNTIPHKRTAQNRPANPTKPPKSPKIYLPCGIILLLLGILMLFLFWPAGVVASGFGIYYIACGPKIYAKLVENYKAVHPDYIEGDS